jgi:hypothetical protein
VSNYQFASEHAKRVDLSRQIADAAVAWQCAEREMEIASALWHTSRAGGGTDDRELFTAYQLREKVRDGALAHLALVTQVYVREFTLEAERG